MRPPILFPLFADVTSLFKVGIKSAELLANLGIKKIADILWHLPYSLINRRAVYSIDEINSGEIITIALKVIEHQSPHKRSQPYRVYCEDKHQNPAVLCFFYAYPSTLEKNLPVDEWRFISGKAEFFNQMLQINHPDYIAADVRDIPLVEPVYALTAGITNKFLMRLVREAFSKLPVFPEWQETHFLAQNKFCGFNEALKTAHNPKFAGDLLPNSSSRLRLAYDELLANQLALAIVRQKIKKKKGRSIEGNGEFRRKVLAMLPFKLTAAQEKVLEEISCDQKSPFRMLRLLQGDVGSGKTIVAFLTMLNAVECGFQASIMAPTEILAQQHFETISEMCRTLGLRAELLSGKIKGKTRDKILSDLRQGQIDILIGTHALFTDDVEFRDLACIIIDEQHRFGVHQRLNLSAKGNHADILVMTATPIPRSLVLTAFGDMEYSKIDMLPEGRKPVDTRVMPEKRIDDIISSLKNKLDKGERAYWVCPLVEESQKTDLAAAEQRFEILSKIFGHKVGLVHGKMKEKEKNEVMEKFRDGEINLLVATTVIEVGVNVKEATVMIIEHAERFGLAQLHQLRGRVKRGVKPAVCLLIYGYPLSNTAKARLQAMKDTEDGFIIAEEDLKLRGGGEILGTKQSGFQNFRMADMSVHQDLLLTASKDAKMIVSEDPELKTPRGQALRVLLYLFERDDAVRTYLSG